MPEKLQKNHPGRVMNIYKGKRQNDWETPDTLFSILNRQYQFTFDLAASDINKKCKKYCSIRKDKDFFSQWFNSKETYWLNPPFGQAKKFYKHVAYISSAIPIKLVSIYKASNFETDTWQKCVFPSAHWVLLIKGRINYKGAGDSSPFPSALIGWNLPPPEGVEGMLIKRINHSNHQSQLFF